MNDYNKVSIIIPCYNVDKFVGRCISSIVNQDYDNIEIIAVDDSSKDNTWSLLSSLVQSINSRSFGSDIEGIGGGKTLLIRKLSPNSGVGRARDYGIRLATGKYVMFVDPDDWIESNTVSECVKSINEYKADVVEFGYQRRRTFDTMNAKFPIQVSVYNTPEVIESKTEHISWNKLYRLDIIKQYKIEFVHRIFEDTLFTRKYSLHCEKAVFISNKFYNYYINSNSLTSNISIERLQQNERTEEVIEFYIQNNLIAQKDKFIKTSLMYLIRQLLPLSRKSHDKFHYKEPSKPFAVVSKPYIDKFNKSPLLFRISAYRLLGLRSAVKQILKFGL